MGYNHYRQVCTECDTLMSQCRCPSKDKQVVPGICDKCKEKLAHPQYREEHTDGRKP